MTFLSQLASTLLTNPKSLSIWNETPRLFSVILRRVSGQETVFFSDRTCSQTSSRSVRFGLQ